VKDGLRERTFRTRDHSGQSELQTGIEQFTEKRYVRAIFNLRQMPPLGKIIDYEVPLKETRDAKHGDIDLLCLVSGAILCVEAKNPLECESILKAILQAFVYTSLAAIRHDQFLADFELPPTLLLTPAIMIGKESGSQLQWGKYPHLGKLVRMLNTELAKSDAGAIRFFIIDNDKSEMKSCLTTVKQPNGDQVIFTNGFRPNVVEWTNPYDRTTKNTATR
jgi:hypothetical protein